MLYVTINKDKAPEIREDEHDLPKGAVEITEEERDGLVNGSLKFENGKVVATS
jgi:hypothetical protein